MVIAKLRLTEKPRHLVWRISLATVFPADLITPWVDKISVVIWDEFVELSARRRLITESNASVARVTSPFPFG